MTTMAIRAMVTRPTRTDFSVVTTMSRISETTMIGKTITAPAIMIRSAATAALPTRAALAVGTASVAAALAVAMEEALAVAMAAVAATAVAAGIAKRRGYYVV